MRGHKVILDKDLADLYGVSTSNLNKAVARNIDRFPDDFMFHLNQKEFENLKFHFGTSSWGGTRKLPRVFTEQGVAMLSSVLRSKRAVAVNIAIMRTFVKLREILSTNEMLRKKIESMEQKYEEQFKLIFNVLSEMVATESKPKSQIGFLAEVKEMHVEERKKRKQN
ncbi:MAG: ORF6N domain-containing protein [Phycisphaerae bacterium]